MDEEKLDELRKFRRSIPGQAKNVTAGACILTGIFFLFYSRNLWLVIPVGVLAPLFLNIPALVYRKISWLHERYNLNLLKIYEFLLTLVVILHTSGSAYLYYLHYEYDILVHFVGNTVLSLLFVLGLDIWYDRKGRPGYSAKYAAKAIFVVGFFFAILWEVYQVSCDPFFKTKVGFNSFQSWLDDSLSDIAGGLLGLTIFTTLVILPFWNYIHSLMRRENPVSRQSPEIHCAD